MISYKIAQTASDYEAARGLFKEYVASVDNDLAFENFEAELSNIRLLYSAPQCGILIAENDQVPVGCSAIRKLENDIAELKRFYVKPAFRGHKIGLQLLNASFQFALDHGYEKIRLDTLANMKKAQELYRSIGFYEIPAYYFSPIAETIYMEKNLKKPGH
jgi:ribosomal protein S18 acetylase RimI-like enzyme